MTVKKRIAHLAVLSALAASLASPALAQAVNDYLDVPGPIVFDGTNYDLAWSAQPSPGYTKQEYVPAGQSPESYESMVMVEFLEADLAPLDMARAQIEMLDARRATDPLVNMALIENEQTGEVLLDFIVSSKDEAGEYILEWNAYRYANVENDAGETGGLLFAISHRAYGNAESEAFLGALRDFKAPLIDELAKAPLPQL